MNFKKIFFYILFFITFLFFIFSVNKLLKIQDSIFSLNPTVFMDFILSCLLIILTSFFYILALILAPNWKYGVGLSFVSSLIALLFLPTPLNYLIAPLIFLVFVISFALLNNKLKNYIDFKPAQLFTPNIKQLSFFLVLISSFGYFLIINNQILTKGFQIPDSLLDFSLKIAGTPDNLTVEEENVIQNNPQPLITPEQLNLLKQNPELLAQYGLNPKVLDQIPTSKNDKPLPKAPPKLIESPIKQILKQQFQTLIKPYENFIPFIFTFIFFLTLQFFSSIISIFIPPLLWLIFYLLEKTGFVKFTEETRVVKKIVI